MPDSQTGVGDGNIEPCGESPRCANKRLAGEDTSVAESVNDGKAYLSYFLSASLLYSDDCRLADAIAPTPGSDAFDDLPDLEDVSDSEDEELRPISRSKSLSSFTSHISHGKYSIQSAPQAFSNRHGPHSCPQTTTFHLVSFHIAIIRSQYVTERTGVTYFWYAASVAFASKSTVVEYAASDIPAKPELETTVVAPRQRPRNGHRCYTIVVSPPAPAKDMIKSKL